MHRTHWLISAQALGLWAAAVGDSTPAYLTPLRCLLPAGVNEEAFEAFVRWLVNAAPAGRDEAVNDVGLGVTGTAIVEAAGRRTGVALFTTQGPRRRRRGRLPGARRGENGSSARVRG